MLSQAQFDVFVNRIQQVCKDVADDEVISSRTGKAVTQSTQKMSESQQTMYETQIPLPSLAEQKRQLLNGELQQQQAPKT